MSREEDIRIEQVCGKFLDENFYSKLGCKFERNSVLSSQYLGVDVTIWSQHGTFVIDEEVKYYGTINKAIDCPSFEITRRDRAGNRSIGWYASGKQLTNTYLFISPFLAEGDQPQQITDDNLSAVQILMVPKKSVSQLAKSCQLSDIDIIERAEALAEGITQGRNEGIWETKTQTVLKMFRRNMPVENIAVISGCSVGEVNEILKNASVLH